MFPLGEIKTIASNQRMIESDLTPSWRGGRQLWNATSDAGDNNRTVRGAIRCSAYLSGHIIRYEMRKAMYVRLKYRNGGGKAITVSEQHGNRMRQFNYYRNVQPYTSMSRGPISSFASDWWSLDFLTRHSIRFDTPLAQPLPFAVPEPSLCPVEFDIGVVEFRVSGCQDGPQFLGRRDFKGLRQWSF